MRDKKAGHSGQWSFYVTICQHQFRAEWFFGLADYSGQQQLSSTAGRRREGTWLGWSNQITPNHFRAILLPQICATSASRRRRHSIKVSSSRISGLFLGGFVVMTVTLLVTINRNFTGRGDDTTKTGSKTNKNVNPVVVCLDGPIKITVSRSIQAWGILLPEEHPTQWWHERGRRCTRVCEWNPWWLWLNQSHCREDVPSGRNFPIWEGDSYIGRCGMLKGRRMYGGRRQDYPSESKSTVSPEDKLIILCK